MDPADPAVLRAVKVAVVQPVLQVKVKDVPQAQDPAVPELDQERECSAAVPEAAAI